MSLQGFIKKARECVSMAMLPETETSPSVSITERVERRTDHRRPPFRYRKIDVDGALSGENGILTLYPAQGDKVEINVWASPNPKHVDQHGNRSRKLFPQTYYRRGKVIASFPRAKGPSLPIGTLYGKPADPVRFPEEYREGLELVAKAIPRGVEAYFADVIHENSQ